MLTLVGIEEKLQDPATMPRGGLARLQPLLDCNYVATESEPGSRDARWRISPRVVAYQSSAGIRLAMKVAVSPLLELDYRSDVRICNRSCRNQFSSTRPAAVPVGFPSSIAIFPLTRT